MIVLEAGTYTDTQGAADHANVAAPTIRFWIRAGLLKSVKLGGAHIIALSDLEKVMGIERKPGPKK